MVDEDPRPPDRSAPPGATCRYHEGRPALAHCPTCDHTVCIVCWHPAVDRCQSCVLLDPEGSGPGVPWELEGVSYFRGYWATLAQAMSPSATAASMRGDDIRLPLSFAMLTWLPLAALQGIIPYTHTLLFKPGFVVEVQGGATSGAIAADVARAAGLGVALGAVQLLGLGLAFASLSTAFGQEGIAKRATAWRGVLYRAFLVILFPAAMVVEGGLVPVDLGFTLLGFAGAGDLIGPLHMILSIGGGVLLLTTLRVNARLSQGTSSTMAFIIPFIALIVAVFARLLAEYAAAPLMPHVAVGAG